MNKSKFSEGKIVQILCQAVKGEKTVAEICGENGISQNILYVSKRKYSRVQTDDLKRLRELEKVNPQLKRIIEDMTLEIDTVKGVMRKNGMALPESVRERTS
jgi:putative transposase